MAFALMLTACWSCSGDLTDVPPETEGREVFIEAYLDLRTRIFTSGTTALEGEVRDSILAVHGVTAEELVEFIDLHGEDIEFMRDLWGEIEGLLTERMEQNAREENDELEED